MSLEHSNDVSGDWGATVKSFMKKWPQFESAKSVESLGWLELELRGGSAQARKKGREDAYGIFESRQVVEITSFPFETSAKTKESFDNT